MRQTFDGANGRARCAGYRRRLSANAGGRGREATCARAFPTSAKLVGLSGHHLMTARLRRQRAKRLRRVAPYLDDVDPELAEDLYQRLVVAGYDALADTVFDLKLIDVCQCSDRTCAGFYTIGRFQLAWLWRYRCEVVDLGAAPVLRVAVTNDRIVAVEVFERPRLRQMLRRDGGHG